MLEHREVFFGGAAGPGKTDALLMAALQHVHVPGYSSLILRRTIPQLNQAGSIMNRAHQWLANSDVQWNRNDKRFTFPSGATLTFGYCESEQDVYQYDSAEFQFIAFDELTSFTENQYTYLFSRLRGVNCDRCEAEKEARDSGREFVGRPGWRHNPLGHVPLRMRCASNPGNRGHDWVRERFMIGRPGWKLAETYPDRFFLPATLDDNPSLRREEYMSNLENLEPVRRRQLMEGDWDVRPAGELFNRTDFEIVDELPREMTLVRAWDTASTKDGGDWTVGVLMGMTRQGIFYVCDVRRVRKNPAEVEDLMKATAQLDDHHVTICIQQEPGSAGKAYVDHLTRRTLRGFSVIPDRPTGDKYTRAKPMSAQATAGNFKLKRAAWNHAFLEELEQAGPDDRLYDHDDQWDAASSAFNYLCENSSEFDYRPVKDPEQSGDYDSRDVCNNSYGFPANYGKTRKSRRFGPGAW